MSSSSEPISVVTGMEEEKYEYIWKIQNLPMVQKDNLLLESQTFEIETGKNSSVQSRWIVGLKLHSSEKAYFVYCKLVELFTANGPDELIANFNVQLKNSSGQVSWSEDLQGRVKLNEGFEVERRRWSTEQNWNAYADSFGAVTLAVNLSILKPLPSQCSDDRAKLYEEQFRMRSVTIPGKHLGRLLLSETTEFDVKIICSDENEFKCHKTVLQSSSPVLYSMLESGLSESKTGIIDIKEISGKTMEVLLQYIYTGELASTWSDPDVIVEFTYAAGKYQIASLLEYLDNMLGYSKKEGDTPTNLLDLLNLASKLELKKAEAKLMDQMVKFVVSAKSSNDILSVFRN